MSYIPKTISEVVSEFLNRTTFLPPIQREYVWGTYAIEKLFDSIMGDFPISTFLFWKIKEENKSEWVRQQVRGSNLVLVGRLGICRRRAGRIEVGKCRQAVVRLIERGLFNRMPRTAAHAAIKPKPSNGTC